jgi:hypothetical protein
MKIRRTLADRRGAHCRRPGRGVMIGVGDGLELGEGRKLATVIRWDQETTQLALAVSYTVRNVRRRVKRRRCAGGVHSPCPLSAHGDH